MRRDSEGWTDLSSEGWTDPSEVLKTLTALSSTRGGSGVCMETQLYHMLQVG